MSNTVSSLGSRPVAPAHLGTGEQFQVSPSYREKMAIAAERLARKGHGFQSVENSRHRYPGMVQETFTALFAQWKTDQRN